MSSTPVLDAVESMLLDAIDDSRDCDLTPPAGAILAATGALSRPRPRAETPIRDLDNPWVLSVLFEGEARPRFLKGNASLSSPVPLVFTDNPKEAITSTTKSGLTFCWPYLIMSHGAAISRRPRAIIHRLKDPPAF